MKSITEIGREILQENDNSVFINVDVLFEKMERKQKEEFEVIKPDEVLVLKNITSVNMVDMVKKFRNTGYKGLILCLGKNQEVNTWSNQQLKVFKRKIEKHLEEINEHENG
jgi:plasmid replication initiation protein